MCYCSAKYFIFKSSQLKDEITILTDDIANLRSKNKKIDKRNEKLETDNEQLEIDNRNIQLKIDSISVDEKEKKELKVKRKIITKI